MSEEAPERIDGNFGDEKYISPNLKAAMEGEPVVFPMPEDEQLPALRRAERARRRHQEED